MPGSKSLLLMHFDGASGGTIFTDSSRFARTVSFAGNINTSTAQKKFGTASAYFDGAGDYLYGFYANLALGAGNFTVDFWIYQTEARDCPIFDTRILGGSASQPNSLGLYTTSARTLILVSSGANNLTTTATVTLNTWTHIAIVRSGNTITIYINGVSVGSVVNSSNFNIQGLIIGRYADADGGYYKGYYDELRVLAGIADWKANFTPPAGAYAK